MRRVRSSGPMTIRSQRVGRGSRRVGSATAGSPRNGQSGIGPISGWSSTSAAGTPSASAVLPTSGRKDSSSGPSTTARKVPSSGTNQQSTSRGPVVHPSNSPWESFHVRMASTPPGDLGRSIAWGRDLVTRPIVFRETCWLLAALAALEVAEDGLEGDLLFGLRLGGLRSGDALLDVQRRLLGRGR